MLIHYFAVRPSQLERLIYEKKTITDSSFRHQDSGLKLLFSLLITLCAQMGRCPHLDGCSHCVWVDGRTYSQGQSLDLCTQSNPTCLEDGSQTCCDPQGTTGQCKKHQYACTGVTSFCRHSGLSGLRYNSLLGSGK